MKKILLSTTAIASLFAASAFAGGMDVRLGGTVEFQSGFKKQTKEYVNNEKLTLNQKNHKFNTEVQTYVKALNKTDNGLTYGGVVSLKNNGQHDSTGDMKNHLFVEGGFGKVQFGQVKSPSTAMAIHAGTIASATGGIDGDWKSYTIGTEVGATESSLVAPKLYIDNINLVADRQKHNTIAFYSPMINGFQVGLSFAPDTASPFTKDQKVEQFEKNTRKNVFSLGLSYEHKADNDTKVTVSAVADKASGAKIFTDKDNHHQFKDVLSYQVGAKVESQGFKVAASYGTHGKADYYKQIVEDGKDKTTINNSSLKKPKFWTAGVGYEQGPMSTSLTYMKSTDSQQVKFNALSLGVDYKMAPGLMPYAEFTKFKHKLLEKNQVAAADGKKKNHSGSVFLLGAKLTF